jgi:hypothetical protein
VQPEIEALPGRFEHTNSFGNYFLSDSVSSDDRDVESFHQYLFTLLPPMAAVTSWTYR